jgi:hypothetical protein
MFIGASDVVLGDAILVVCIDTAEFYLLGLLNAAGTKELGGEDSIICVISFDGIIVTGS